MLPTCTAALNGRYPLDRASRTDVNLDDFSRLFAPGGMIDAFFQAHLRELVDTSRRPWRMAGADIGIAEGSLRQFEHAAMIRDALFAGGGGPSARFEITPVGLDASAVRVLLVVDGQSLEYAHGAPRPTAMQWPGPGAGLSRLSFAPQLPDGSSSVSHTGPWSLFRLLDQGRVQGTGLPDRFSVTLGVGGRTATFDVRVGSVFNPFTLTALERFRCPSL